MVNSWYKGVCVCVCVCVLFKQELKQTATDQTVASLYYYMIIWSTY